MTVALQDRFWSKVDRSSQSCWNWQAATDQSGYGRVLVNGQNRRAHRIAWELTHGEIPAGDGYHGVCVLHQCDNPACCNPLHLFLGSQRENIADMQRKGRHGHGSKTHCAKGHPFDDANTMTYGNHRMCRSCHRTNSRNAARRRRATAPRHQQRIPT